MNNNARIGGIISIISGAFGLVHFAISLFFIFIFNWIFTQVSYPYHEAPPVDIFTFMGVFYGAIGLFLLLIGVLGIVGGVFILRKRRWGLALAGAIAGTFTFFPVGIPAIISVAMAKPEFSTTNIPETIN